MIPKAYITEWSKTAPWIHNYQVEQDLIIEKSLVEIFSNDELKELLAFRGGTALHKLYLRPQVRYSEDIDLVQINAGEIGPILTLLREQLSFLGNARYERTLHNNTLTYRFTSEFEGIPLNLKIEINTREHFNVFGHSTSEHNVKSEYYTGKSTIKTYSIEELLGTKLRALYQRNKGRDLFDIWYAVSNKTIEIEKVLNTFRTYMNYENHTVTSREYIENMEQKIADNDFNGDVQGLIRPQIAYDGNAAYTTIKELIIDKI